MKTYPKISSFQHEIPGFEPRVFGTDSERASNELRSASGLRRVKMQPEQNDWTTVNIL